MTRTRRIVSRVALAGAVAVVPVAAVAVPAFAATPNAIAVNWHNQGGDDHHNGPGPRDPQGPQFPQGPRFPQFRPPTGSAG